MGIALPIMTWSAASQAPWAAVPLHLLPGAETGAASGASSYALQAAAFLSPPSALPAGSFFSAASESPASDALALPGASTVSESSTEFPMSDALREFVHEAKARMARSDYDGAILFYKKALAEEQKLGYQNSLTLLHLAISLRKTGRTAEAVTALQGAIEIQPHPRTYYELAATLSVAKRDAEALEEIDKAIGFETSPRPNSHYLKGIILRRLGRLEESATALSRAIDLEVVDYPRSHFELAQTLLEMEDYDAAIKRAQIGLEKGGKVGAGLGIIGAVHLARGDYAEAVRILNQGIAKDPGDPRLYETLAHVFLTMGNPEKALAVIENAPPLLQNQQRLRVAKAEALKALSREEEARELLAAATEISGQERPIKQAGRLQREERLEEALLTLQGAVVHKPTAHAYCEMGIVLRLLKRYREAAEAFTEAIRLESHVRSYFERSIVFNLMKDFPRALSDIDDAIRLGGENHPMSFAVKAGILRRMDWLEEAESFLRAVLLQFPGDGAILLELGLTLRDQEKWEEAATVLKEALDKDPKNPNILSKLAKLLRRLGRFQEALMLVVEMIRISPSAFIYFESALLLFGLHRYDESLTMLEQAEALGHFPKDYLDLREKLRWARGRGRG